MTEGVDYSWARPDPTCLRASGRRFAVRYVGTTASGKNLDRSEVHRLQSAGLDLVSVYQTTAGFMADGASGATAALRALNDAAHCGMPTNRPIYFALDMDPGRLTASAWLKVEQFLSEAARVLGGTHHVGVYGGIDAIDRLVPNVAAYGWQTYAWSGGRVSPRAHLLQYRNGVALCGGTVDLCRSLAEDFGQWTYQAVDPEPPKPVEVDVKGVIILPMVDDLSAGDPEWRGAWLLQVGCEVSWIRNAGLAAWLVYTGQAHWNAGGPFPVQAAQVNAFYWVKEGTDDPRTLDVDESVGLDAAEVERVLAELHAASALSG